MDPTDGLLHLEDIPAPGSRRPPVVFLHGLGSRGQDWSLQLEALRGRCRLLAPDLSGHGNSIGFSDWPDVRRYSRRVAQALDAADVTHSHLVGLSLGGAVGLCLALESPERVVSLTLVNSFSRLVPTPRGALRGMIRLGLVLAGRIDLAAGWVASELFPSADQARLRRIAVERLAPNRRADYLRAIVAALRFDLRPRLSEIRCPTLIVRGQADRSLAFRTQIELRDGIAGARLVVLPGSTHATPINSAGEFNRLLVGFLDQAETSAVG